MLITILMQQKMTFPLSGCCLLSPVKCRLRKGSLFIHCWILVCDTFLPVARNAASRVPQLITFRLSSAYNDLQPICYMTLHENFGFFWKNLLKGQKFPAPGQNSIHTLLLFHAALYNNNLRCFLETFSHYYKHHENHFRKIHQKTNKST